MTDTSYNFLIYYFTGTGNSRWTSQTLAELLSKNGSKVAIQNIEKGMHPHHAEFDTHGFVFPVLGFGVPHIMRKFILSFPKSQGKSAFVLSCLGEILERPGKVMRGYEGGALHRARAMLRRRGYGIINSATISMPENWIAIGNTPRPEVNQKITELGQSQLMAVASKISARKNFWKATSIFWRIVFFTDVFFYLFTFIGRRMFSAFFVADGNCNACGVCAKTCPVHVIKMKGGRPHWGLECENCMRCISFCPQSSIQMTYLPVVIYLIIIAVFDSRIEYAADFAANITHIWPIHTIFGIIAATALYSAAFLTVKKAFAYLFDYNCVRAMLEWSFYTRKFRRYKGPLIPPSRRTAN